MKQKYLLALSKEIVVKNLEYSIVKESERMSFPPKLSGVGRTKTAATTIWKISPHQTQLENKV
jgi:hypothetical protein